MEVPNTLTYYDTATITAVQSFILQVPVVIFKKLDRFLKIIWMPKRGILTKAGGHAFASLKCDDKEGVRGLFQIFFFGGTVVS